MLYWCRQRGAPELACARPGHPGLGRRQVEAPHVEVALPAAERLLLEQGVHEAGRVGVELGNLGRRVPLADHEQIDLLRGRPALEEGPHLAGGLAIRGVDEPGGGVDDGGPELAEAVVRVPALEHDLDRGLRPRKPQRFVEAAVRLAVLRRRLPLAVDGREATGVQDPVGPSVDHLEPVLPQIEVVDEPRPAARPRSVGDHLVEGEDLLPQPAGMDVVQPHGLVQEPGVEPRLLSGQCVAAGRDDHHEEETGSDAHHAPILTESAPRRGRPAPPANLPLSIAGESMPPAPSSAAACRSPHRPARIDRIRAAADPERGPRDPDRRIKGLLRSQAGTRA